MPKVNGLFALFSVVGAARVAVHDAEEDAAGCCGGAVTVGGTITRYSKSKNGLVTDEVVECGPKGVPDGFAVDTGYGSKNLYCKSKASYIGTSQSAWSLLEEDAGSCCGGAVTVGGTVTRYSKSKGHTVQEPVTECGPKGVPDGFAVDTGYGAKNLYCRSKTSNIGTSQSAWSLLEEDAGSCCGGAVTVGGTVTRYSKSKGHTVQEPVIECGPKGVPDGFAVNTGYGTKNLYCKSKTSNIGTSQSAWSLLEDDAGSCCGGAVTVGGTVTRYSKSKGHTVQEPVVECGPKGVPDGFAVDTGYGTKNLYCKSKASSIGTSQSAWSLLDASGEAIEGVESGGSCYCNYKGYDSQCNHSPWYSTDNMCICGDQQWRKQCSAKCGWKC